MGINVIHMVVFVTIGAQIVYSQEYIDGETSKDVKTEADLVNYLSEYGWLGDANGPVEINSKDVIQEKLSEFQSFFNLPVTGILDNATKELMSKPRCGYPDVFTEEDGTRKKRFEVIGLAWSRRALTWFLENDSNDNLNRIAVEQEIDLAFQRWADASGTLTFSKAQDANSADIRLSFQVRNHGDGAVFDGPGGTLAHAFPPGSGLGGDVHFDDDELFLISSRFNLHQITTHELGHSLGLGHSSFNTAVMAPFYRDVDPNVFELHFDDINGIKNLYETTVPQTARPRPPITRAPTTLAPTTTTPTPTPTPSGITQPIYCNAKFDAATESFDDGVYFFQGEQVYKVKPSVGVVGGYPKRLSEEFNELNIGSIDAALTYQVNSNFIAYYIFKGDNYWRFDQRRIMAPGYPKSITLQWGGIPANLDAAFIWSGNGFVYFIKGTQYYRYNPRIAGVDTGYPRPLTIWKGVETPVDGVFIYEGQTFFLGGQYHQQFNDSLFTANDKLQSGPKWLGCVTGEPPDGGDVTTSATDETTENITANCNLVKSQYVVTLILYMIYLLMQY